MAIIQVRCYSQEAPMELNKTLVCYTFYKQEAPMELNKTLAYYIYYKQEALTELAEDSKSCLIIVCVAPGSFCFQV